MWHKGFGSSEVAGEGGLEVGVELGMWLRNLGQFRLAGLRSGCVKVFGLARLDVWYTKLLLRLVLGFWCLSVLFGPVLRCSLHVSFLRDLCALLLHFRSSRGSESDRNDGAPVSRQVFDPFDSGKIGFQDRCGQTERYPAAQWCPFFSVLFGKGVSSKSTNQKDALFSHGH